MSDIYLELIDKLAHDKADLRYWQVLELQALESIQSYIHIQEGLKDDIERQEETLEKLRKESRFKEKVLGLLVEKGAEA